MSNIDPNLIRQAMNTGDTSALTGALSPEDMKKVQSVLADKEKMQQILNSPLAKSLLKQMGK